MSRRQFPRLLASWVILLFPIPILASDPIPPEQFSALRELIKPKPGEDAWLQIPWQTSLWQARRKALAEGKPILLWEMDGHPLGCT
jgi:hypothetical protein